MNWISVKDKLPCSDYVVVTNGKLTWTAKYICEQQRWTTFIDDCQEPGYTITHWIHFEDLPKP